MKRNKISLPILRPHTPGRGYRWLRRLCQLWAFVALALAPFLGGWQRLERNYLSGWDGHGWDLPPALIDELPGGATARHVHELNLVLGGGSASEYFSIPFVDPVLGFVALFEVELGLTFLIALGLPVLLGLLVGRGFCGWFCPYGTVARVTEALLKRLPWRPAPLELPAHRALRWIVLSGVLIASLAFGIHVGYLLLPHLMVQQSAYAFWLMGGGGAILGWLCGLFVAGLWLGPTSYCALICPTGTFLAALGRLRVVGITLASPRECGERCNLCARSCWLGLDPASGDPGPDCDACTRCFEVCPRTNLRVGVFKPRLRFQAALLLPLVLLLATTPSRAATESYRQVAHPRLILSGERRQGQVRALLSVVDLKGVRRDADNPVALNARRIALVLSRGSKSAADEFGRLLPRETYQGPIHLHFEYPDGSERYADLERPSAPESTPRRALYQLEVRAKFEPGTIIRLDAIEGWTEHPLEWKLPPPNAGTGQFRLLGSALAGFLLFSGMISVAFALGHHSTHDARAKTGSEA